MENVDKELTADTPELTSDKDPKTVVKATVLLIQKRINDQVFSVRLKNVIPPNYMKTNEGIALQRREILQTFAS